MNKKEYMKKYRLEHKEQLKEYKKKYNEIHKEELKEKRKEYYEQNKDKFNVNHKEYYELNKEQIYKSQTKYRHTHSKQVSQMVLVCKRRKVELLRSQGITNAWAVVNYHKEPKYKKSNLIQNV